MSDHSFWKELEIPVKVLSYTPGRKATYWDPAEPAEIEWEIDAPAEVRAWLIEQLDDDDLSDIESSLIEREEDAIDAQDYARAIEAELSQWDSERQRQADYAYDPLRVNK